MILTVPAIVIWYCFGQAASAVVPHSDQYVSVVEAARTVMNAPQPWRLLNAADFAFVATIVMGALIVACVRTWQWTAALAIAGLIAPFIVFDLLIPVLPLVVLFIPFTVFGTMDGEGWSDGLVAAQAAGAWMWLCALVVLTSICHTPYRRGSRPL